MGENQGTYQVRPEMVGQRQPNPSIREIRELKETNLKLDKLRRDKEKADALHKAANRDPNA